VSPPEDGGGGPPEEEQPDAEEDDCRGDAPTGREGEQFDQATGDPGDADDGEKTG
jgi:hypothetical protein